MPRVRFPCSSASSDDRGNRTYFADSRGRHHQHLRWLLLLGLLAALVYENCNFFALNRGLKSFIKDDAIRQNNLIELELKKMQRIEPTINWKKHRQLEQLLQNTDSNFRANSSTNDPGPNSIHNITTEELVLEFDEASPYYLFGKYRYQYFDRHIDPKMENRKALYLLDKEAPSWIGISRTSELYHTTSRRQQLVTADMDNPTNNTQINQSLLRSLLPSSFNVIPTEYEDTDTWVLSQPMRHATRNHDTIILERATRNPSNNDNSVIAVTLLGRHNRHVQWLDLITGEQGAVRTGGGTRHENQTDPDGWPLDDLNHVSAVLVDSLSENGDPEIWMTCGFHNDEVNSEVSSQYARIVDTSTWQVRVGPKLPIAGGACVAHAVNIVTGEPPMICNLGGTQGTHDRGKFLRQTACYDRLRQKWWNPLGDLPYGLDHGSLAAIPAGVCRSDDPARLIVLNFRTKPYGDAHTEMLAYDLPANGWTLNELESLPEGSTRTSSNWYVYYNGTSSDDERENSKDVGRDASGTIVVNGGRDIVNFGGTYHYLQDRPGHKKKRVRGRFSMIRSFDVCRKQWSIVGDLGMHTFALQTAASQDLQVALTCGGETTSMKNSNGHWCYVNRFHNGMVLSNRYERQ